MINKKREILYFAYGSNLKHQQMESRCPGFKYIKNFYLKGYKLCFSWNKYRRDRTGVANIEKQNNPTKYMLNTVPGAIYSIKEKHKDDLRRREGYPLVYIEDYFTLDKKKVFFYIMKNFAPKRPGLEYAKKIKQGYKDCNLDIDFLRRRLGHYHIEI